MYIKFPFKLTLNQVCKCTCILYCASIPYENRVNLACNIKIKACIKLVKHQREMIIAYIPQIILVYCFTHSTCTCIIHIYNCTIAHIHIHVQSCVHVYTHTPSCIHIILIHVHIYMYMYMYIHSAHTCTCICGYCFTHTQYKLRKKMAT